ncbi:hypothetical protein lerEdw1_002548 [Lerista edwardsae]|nr:hypothetical protein lerEdw1_002548 [Lerista edwardsae]
MGRSYFVEEAVGQYLSELNIHSKPLITGLLVGQCSPQRDYVVLAIRTPPKEEESKNNQSYRSELSKVDEEWTTAHASQQLEIILNRLLSLSKLVFSVENSVVKKRLWSASEEDVSDRVALHLCSATKKYPFFHKKYCLFLNRQNTHLWTQGGRKTRL